MATKIDLKAHAEAFVNGPDNGTAEVLALLLENIAAKAWDEGYVAGNAFGYEWAQDTYDGPAEDPTPNPYAED